MPGAEPFNKSSWRTTLAYTYWSTPVAQVRLFGVIHLFFAEVNAVYLTIAGRGSEDVLLLDFGTFWQAATIKRWVSCLANSLKFISSSFYWGS